MTTTSMPGDGQGQGISRRELSPEVFNLLVVIWHTGARTKERLLYELMRALERDTRLGPGSGRSVCLRPPRRITRAESSDLEIQTSLNLDALVESGHVRKLGSGNVLEIAKKGRELLLLDPKNLPPRDLGVLSSDADWENLILKVLALKVNEEDFCLEDLLRDLRVLDARFGYRVKVEAEGCLEKIVGRTVRWLAGEWDEDIGRPKRIERPEIKIVRRGDGRERITISY